MDGLAGILRWAALRTLSRPTTWVLLAAGGALWCAVTVLSPVGLTTRNSGSEALIYELAFLSALAGTSLSLTSTGVAEWWFALVAPARRFGLRLTLLVAGGALGLLVGAWGPAVALGRLPAPGAFLGASLLGLAHLVAIGLWLDRVEVRRAMALPLLAWLLPALVGNGSVLGRLFGGVVDAARHFDPDRGVLARPAEVLPIVGLLAGAALLDLGYSARAAENPRGSGPVPPPHRSPKA